MTAKFEFAIDEKVRIKVGPFQNFTASVIRINKEKGLLRVKVNIFGRSQPVAVTFLEVEKVDPTQDRPTRF